MDKNGPTVAKKLPQPEAIQGSQKQQQATKIGQKCQKWPKWLNVAENDQK